AGGADGRAGRPGQPQEAQGDRREHQEDRSPGRPGPGRVPRPGHDPRGPPAHAPAAPASGADPPPAVPPGADHAGPHHDPPPPGRLQRRPRGPVLGRPGPAYLKGVPLSDADRFVLEQLWAQWLSLVAQRLELTEEIKAFAAKAAQREKEDRAILKTAPGVG